MGRVKKEKKASVASRIKRTTMYSLVGMDICNKERPINRQYLDDGQGVGNKLDVRPNVYNLYNQQCLFYSDS